MAEHADDATVRQVVAAAIAAAGPVQGANLAQWKAKVTALIGPCTAVLGAGSAQSALARQVLEAPIITGTYLGHEVEESSTRAVVRFTAREGEIETIRTERTDRSIGQSMLGQLNRLTEGQQIRIWKGLEEMAGRSDRKVRVLVHMEPLPNRNAAAEPAPTAAPQTGTGRAPGSAPNPPEAPPVPNDGRAAIRAGLASLPVDKREKIVAAMREKGWLTADDIPADKLETARYMVEHDGKDDHF